MSRKKRRYWTLDCETDPFREGRVPVPFLWGIYDGETYEYWEFEKVEALVEFLRDKDVIVYAHNGGKFDYHYLRQWIEADVPLSVIGGRLARFQIGACEFRDSLNLFGQTRLKDFNKTEIDYKKLEKSCRKEHWQEIRDYLKSDCVNLWNLLNGFIERYGMQFTQAGASMKLWSKTYKKPIPQSTPEYYERFHPFYYGGRVQCFAQGHVRQDFKVIDINSAYPRAMLEQHPYSTDAILSKRLPDDPVRAGPCMVEVLACAHGCFPMYTDSRDGLYFPDDKKSGEVRRYYITGWELLAALDTKTVSKLSIENVHKFSETTDFKEYTNDFYSQRQIAKANGDKMGDIFAKIFLNSLYGKFASNPSRYQEYVIPSLEKLGDWIKKGYVRDGNWVDRDIYTRKLPEDKRRYYNVATAASITGWVRSFLWRSIRQCEGVLYCDTDSIACETTGDLQLGSNLGEWKHEFDADAYAIAGKKMYAFHKSKEFQKQKDFEPEEPWRVEWKVASKGVRLSPDEIIALSEGRTFSSLARVPNYSIHRKEIAFINRTVRNTYKDISQFPEAA